MRARAPVADWATDFDHLDPQWVENPYPIWKDMRGRCPIAHTTRYGGAYCPTAYVHVRAIAYDTKHFSSRRVVVRETPAPALSNAPINSDPPEHTSHRRQLLPAFTPQAIARLEPMTRALCQKLVEDIGDRLFCDGAIDYAQHIPTRIIAHLLGLPEGDSALYRRWIHQTLDEGVTDEAASLEAWAEMTVYLRRKLAERTQQSEGGLIGTLMQGETVDEEHVIGVLRLLLIAGVDTTWSAIAASLLHLATHAADRERLVADPSVLDTTIEELLRAYAPVTMAREIVAACEIDGVRLEAGQMVLLPFGAANRDPAMFPDPDRIVIDRAVNPHVAFGLGRHRCIGASLARMELRVALECWLAKFPDFHLDRARQVTWSRGSVRGPRSVPLALVRAATGRGGD